MQLLWCLCGSKEVFARVSNKTNKDSTVRKMALVEVLLMDSAGVFSRTLLFACGFAALRAAQLQLHSSGALRQTEACCPASTVRVTSAG